MNIFLDTNVLLGYTFETDHWNGKSIAVVSSSCTKYVSSVVVSEFDYKTRDIKRTIKTMFNEFKGETRSYTSKGEMLSYLKTLSSDTFPIKSILVDIINHCSSPSVDDIVDSINDYQNAFEQRCISNSDHLKKIITTHNRTCSYNSIYDEFLLDGFVQEDINDAQIVIDAHDLCQTVSSLFFITGDYAHIVSRKSLIEEVTDIKKVVYLKEFDFT